jgi:hypothetical protein
MQEHKDLLRDAAIAERLFSQANRAIVANDFETLKGAIRQLWQLYPFDEQSAAEPQGFGGTTIMR